LLGDPWHTVNRDRRFHFNCGDIIHTHPLHAYGRRHLVREQAMYRDFIRGRNSWFGNLSHSGFFIYFGHSILLPRQGCIGHR
jgi:hypothetical protein